MAGVHERRRLLLLEVRLERARDLASERPGRVADEDGAEDLRVAGRAAVSEAKRGRRTVRRTTDRAAAEASRDRHVLEAVERVAILQGQGVARGQRASWPGELEVQSYAR